MEAQQPTYNREDYTPDAKRARFLRVAERRTNAVLNDIRLISNTSNRTLYQYSEQDVEKIFNTIYEKLAESKMKFTSAKKAELFRLE